MDVVDDIRETLGPNAGGEPSTYRCTDCMAEFDERRQLCPKCGSGKVESV